MAFSKNGCNVRTCTITIGAISLATSVFCLIFILKWIDKLEVQKETKIDEMCEEFRIQRNDCDVNSDDKFKCVKLENIELETSISIGVFITSGVMASVSAVTSAFVIIGAIKGETWFIMPWISHLFFGIIEASMPLVYYSTKFSGKEIPNDVFITITFIISGIAMCLFSILIVSSCFSMSAYEKSEQRRIFSFAQNPNLHSTWPTKKLLYDTSEKKEKLSDSDFIIFDNV